ncbi:uncharacterized protein LOC135475168 [Liolophura sinensis]|uniref:uncharacterized protein LOC135475168 n=1 Tax=Liolophura sinensis TaxID=3198878 RepID=UPI003158F52C
MEKEDWEKIEEKRLEIVRDLDATELVEYLIQDGIFHLGDKERVCHEVTSLDKATKLMKILKCKHGSYKSFYRGLRKVQSFIADMLRPPADITPANNPVAHIKSFVRGI